MTQRSRRKATLAAALLAGLLALLFGGLALVLRPASAARGLQGIAHAAPSADADAPARERDRAERGAPQKHEANVASTADAELPPVIVDPRLVARIRSRIAEYEMLASRRSKGKVAGREVSVAVHVRETGRRGELVAIEADRPMRPASNLKLVTSSAALVLLGADWRFETILETAGPIEGGTLRGDLVVRAAGDPLYDRGEEAGGDGDVRALLAPAIAALGKRGLKSIDGALVLDELDFAAPGPGPGWPDPGQRWAEFCALSGGFSANAGCLTATVRPGKGGAQADVLLEPRYHGFERRGRVATGAAKTRLDVRVEARSGSALVEGSIPSSVPSWSTRFAVPDPVELFGNVLAGELRAAGIDVLGGIRRAHPPSTGKWEELARISTPLAAVVDAMNTDSNNACADQLFLALGHARGGGGTREGGRAAVVKALERLGVNADGLVQVDGSGLSRDDRVTARQITALIAAVLRQDEGTSKAFVDSMAVASETGTLDDRMSDKRLAGRVHAKTGFIGGTSALSGILDARDGRRFVFSILVEYPSYDGLNRECWKPMEDAICAELAGADEPGG
jgi:D-alanyl-D-alanine carboxypeptidase/D-alanyl-D-alanine-endopeptidase (penicillin-binding protein 4)